MIKFSRANTFLFLMCIVLTALGAIYIHVVWISSTNLISKQVLEIAQTAALIVDTEELKSLQALPSDLETKAYQNIKAKLIHLTKIQKNICFSYIYVQKEGRLYFLSDSETLTSKDYSPPGQEYTEAGIESVKPFIDGKVLITPPYIDRRGKWISILIPLLDSKTGKTLAVFGQDYPADEWNAYAIARTGQASLAVLSFIVLVLVFYILYRVYQNKKDTKDTLEATLEALPDLLFEVGLDGYCYSYHSPYKELLFNPGDKIIGNKINDILPVDVAEIEMSAIREAHEKGLSTGKQYKMTVPAGEVWFEMSVSRKASPAEQPRFIILSRNISDRKMNEEKITALLGEKELLLKEIHHRIKNNMNTIYGLLILQAGGLKDLSAITALQDAAGRVRSMMVLYDKLYQSASFNEISVAHYLPSLLTEIVSNFPNSVSVKLVQNIDDFILDAKRLQPLGILLNELLTNIMKYAFTDRTDGIITVSATKQEKRVSISVSDNGNGMPASIDFQNSTGFGLMLVDGLTKQLDGTIRIERVKGTTIILEFNV